MLDRLRGDLGGSRHDHVSGSADAELMLREILGQGAPGADDVCVDLGAGGWFLTLPLARVVRTVVAVDGSAAIGMEPDRGVGRNIEPRRAALMSLILPYDSVDLVVSAYALHHLHHADKRAIVARAHRWLRPGGRIVIGDLMYERRFALGVGLLWHALRVGDRRPAPPHFWIEALREAGFDDVGHAEVSPRSGVVWGTCARATMAVPTVDASVASVTETPDEAPPRGRIEDEG